MDLTKKISIFVFLLCILISLKNRRAETDAPSLLEDPPSRRILGGDESLSDSGEQNLLKYDYYRSSCPSAEKLIWSTMKELYAVNTSVAPALLRLLFHDCFIMECDASVLLNSHGQIKSEKDTHPNLSLKGFEEIDIIKSKLEEVCPGVVSCADTLALAARESVLLSGGQFYAVLTGRKDSIDAFPQSAENDIPHPEFVLEQTLKRFASRGFDARETVALLGGGHSIGKIHCNFIRDRLFHFQETDKPDPSIDAEFLEVLRSECSHPLSSAPSLSPSPSSSSPTASASFENRAMRMDYEGVGKGFGEVYYRSLLKGKGLLFVDQQLTSHEDTKAWVESYLSESLRFRIDFAQAMVKLSHLQSSSRGEVRLNCRKVN